MLSVPPKLRVYTTCDRVTTQFDIDHRVTPRIMSIFLIPDPINATGEVFDSKKLESPEDSDADCRVDLRTTGRNSAVTGCCS